MIDNTHAHEKSEEFFPGIMYDTFYINSKLLQDEQNPNLCKIMQDYVATHREWYLRKLQRLSKDYDGKDLRNYYQARKANFKALIPAFESKE